MKGVDTTAVLADVTGDGVLTLTLNRPERANAWNRELEMALHDLLEQAAESDDVRAIIITGAGRTFCPGLDMEDLSRVSSGTEGYDQSGRRPMVLPCLVPKPVICAINGGCAGLGLVTALFSDIRLAADGAKITTAFARRGLPAEEAVAWILPRIVGHASALDLLLTGRIVTGREAAGLGLVHRSLPADDLLPAAMACAVDMAQNCSPLAMATAKRQVYADWERSLPEGRAASRRLVGALKARAGDFAEGVASYVEKRPPRFAPLSEPVDYADFIRKGA